MTFFTTPSSRAVSPNMTFTMVINPQISHHVLNLRLHFLRHHIADRSRSKLILHPPLRSGKQPRLLPLRALAILPRRRAQVAELASAEARHVVAPQIELDERLAAGTRLPTLPPSESPQLDR